MFRYQLFWEDGSEPSADYPVNISPGDDIWMCVTISTTSAPVGPVLVPSA
jgi:hypothetical protein